MRFRVPLLLIIFFLGLSAAGNKCFAQTGINDTITTYAVIYKGDTLSAKDMDWVYIHARQSAAARAAAAKYNRLRNAVYVTYPYARRAGAVMNDINAHLAAVKEKDQRKKYILSREKELKKEFRDPLMNLSVYQGKVLMKLINRETGNNCYEIIKEYRGGLEARLYQTVAFFFDSNLKQSYDPETDDVLIERFVREVQRMYGYNEAPHPKMM